MKKMKSMIERIRANEDRIVHIIEELGGAKAAVYGSVARGEEAEASDVDILINIKPAEQNLPLEL